MIALLIFILFIVVALIVGNQEDKRRFKNKAKEIGLDEWEEDLTGDSNYEHRPLRRTLVHHNNNQQ